MAGKNKAGRPYFEGWYFKCRTKDGKTIALIPAIHKDGRGQDSASLQVIYEAGTWWLEYPDLNMPRKQPHDERGDASATPERFFLVFRRSNSKHFVNKRYISLKVVLNGPFETG